MNADLPLRTGHAGSILVGVTPHPELLDRVRMAFNEVDPAGLLRHGFPDDEYNPEVRELAGLLSSGGDLTTTAVRDVLVRWFKRADDDDVQRIVELIASGEFDCQ